MIAFVRGEVTAVGPDSAVVDVGGIGIAVQAAPPTLAALVPGSAATLPTSLVVREDSLTLFGFADDDERRIFEQLQSASGVGPKLALAVLAALTPDELRCAVASEDWAALTAVSGIGKKGAQRIVLDLRDKLGAPAGSAPSVPARSPSARAEPWREQVSAALLGLGWSAKEAEEALTAAASVADETRARSGAVDVPVVLRAALATLNRAESRA